MLRPVVEGDLPTLFEHQRDPEATRVALFPGRDWDAFLTHWQTKVLGDPANDVRTVVFDGQVAGYVGSWDGDGKRLVGYWIGRQYWGRGLATAALAEFVTTVDTRRPIHAYVVSANVRSTRVLEKCGFKVFGPATTVTAGVEEILFRLDASSGE